MRNFSWMVPNVALASIKSANAVRCTAHEKMGGRGEPEQQLSGAHGRRQCPVGKEIALTFLQPVLNHAALAADVLVAEAAGPEAA